MGTPAPPPWPTLLPGLWYKVYVEAWGGAPPWNNCGGTMLGIAQCCRTGAQIMNWVRFDWQCSGLELCMFTGFTEQRIVDIDGPYLTQEHCILTLYT